MSQRRDRPERPAPDDRKVVEPGAADGARSPGLPDWILEMANVDRGTSPEPTGAELAPAFLTVREKAAKLRVCEKTVLRMVKRGELPFTKVGRQYRFPG
jgi:excisionase family DNA binding protein